MRQLKEEIRVVRNALGKLIALKEGRETESGRGGDAGGAEQVGEVGPAPQAVGSARAAAGKSEALSG